MLENRQNMDDDRMGRLESSLKEAQDSATEADKKYEEVSFLTAVLTRGQTFVSRSMQKFDCNV